MSLLSVSHWASMNESTLQAAHWACMPGRIETMATGVLRPAPLHMRTLEGTLASPGGL